MRSIRRTTLRLVSVPADSGIAVVDQAFELARLGA